ncbi:hypothetical protein [Pseudorhodoferax sp.]|nr:hypothetical protein [Pseudorhodoferax sp.]
MPSPELPNISADSFRRPDLARLLPAERAEALSDRVQLRSI